MLEPKEYGSQVGEKLSVEFSEWQICKIVCWNQGSMVPLFGDIVYEGV